MPELRTANEWIALSVAQHHGLPTRMLDWARNPLASLWLAVKKPPNNKKDAVLYILKPKDEDFYKDEKNSPFEIEKIKVYEPEHLTKRIIVQGGLFTVHPLLDENTFGNFLNNGIAKRALSKFFIRPEDFCQIRYELDRCAVNKYTLFADLDALCGHVERLHSLAQEGKSLLQMVVRNA